MILTGLQDGKSAAASPSLQHSKEAVQASSQLSGDAAQPPVQAFPPLPQGQCFASPFICKGPGSIKSKIEIVSVDVEADRLSFLWGRECLLSAMSDQIVRL